MRFAVFGDHPDGWAVASALAASGRHQIVAFLGLPPESATLDKWPQIAATTDLEEVLADPDIDAAIVAGKLRERLDQLRRVLQSERSAFCVHPVDVATDGAYEVNLLQGDTHQLVIPILPLAVNRTVGQLSDEIERRGPPRLVELEVRSVGEVLFEADATRPHFPGWEVLRGLGGVIAEVQAFAREEAARPGEPVTVQGRFESGALFRTAFFPFQPVGGIRVGVHWPEGESSSAAIQVVNDDWMLLVDRFEAAVARLRASPRAVPGTGPAVDGAAPPTWLDEIRAAELDDAARRGIERRRAIALDYQDVSEDVGFKGTMTLLGCGLLWFIPVLLILSVWLPYVGWLIIPVLFGFLLLQLLRWFVPLPAARQDSRRDDH